MTYIFGPVPSRRLGLSLGIDLIPPKTCTYDCLYCQVGRTTCLTAEPDMFVPTGDVIEELRDVIEKTHPDTVTLAGSGEPTLHSEIDRIISLVKDVTDTRVALLTNGALLWRKEVRDRVLGADIIMPTLTTVFEETFRKIHRPHRGLGLPSIIGGLKKLREEYGGIVLIEIVLLSGINDNMKELEGIKEVMQDISPDKIQLNTVVRPPSDPRAMPLNMEQMEKIRDFFGKKAEIIASVSADKKAGEYGPNLKTIVEMARRRPVTEADIAGVLNISREESERVLKGLLLKGDIKKQEHEGEVYYTALERKVQDQSGNRSYGKTDR
jgi:wyosine [tRNA(Phe)-imidazoG37] synthetase (radical SAM superfamily)